MMSSSLKNNPMTKAQFLASLQQLCKKPGTFATDVRIQTISLNLNLIFLYDRKPIVQIHT